MMREETVRVWAGDYGAIKLTRWREYQWVEHKPNRRVDPWSRPFRLRDLLKVPARLWRAVRRLRRES